jgi:hypothetical protein
MKLLTAKMTRLTKTLAVQFEESRTLEPQILTQIKKIGYGS